MASHILLQTKLAQNAYSDQLSVPEPIWQCAEHFLSFFECVGPIASSDHLNWISQSEEPSSGSAVPACYWGGLCLLNKPFDLVMIASSDDCF